MKNTTIIITLIGLLSTSAFSRGGKGFKVLDDLNLTSEQLEQIKQFKSEHKKKRKAMKGDRKLHRDQMKNLFVEGASDNELRKLHQSIKEHRGGHADMKLEKMIFLKNLLTKEQRVTYMEKKKENRKKRMKRDDRKN